MINVRDFGAVGDGKTYDTDAFLRAIDAVPPVLGTSGGQTILVPPGDYKLSELRVTRSIRLMGAGAAGFGADSLLHFAEGGLVLDHFSRQGGDKSRSTDHAIIENLLVVGPGTGARAGILAYARPILRGVLVNGFGGHGVEFTSEEDCNINNWQIDNCQIVNCGRSGLYVHGVSSNAGLATLLSADGNAEFGVRDDSFLGNSYLGLHVAMNRGKLVHRGVTHESVDIAIGTGINNATPPPPVMPLGGQVLNRSWVGGTYVEQGGRVALGDSVVWSGGNCAQIIGGNVLSSLGARLILRGMPDGDVPTVAIIENAYGRPQESPLRVVTTVPTRTMWEVPPTLPNPGVPPPGSAAGYTPAMWSPQYRKFVWWDAAAKAWKVCS